MPRKISGVSVPEESFEKRRERMLKGTRAAIKEAYESEEYSLMQAINAYNETNKLYNLVNERLSEWFGIYFPDIKISSPKAIAEISMLMYEPEMIKKEQLESILNDGAKAEGLYAKLNEGTSRKINEGERGSIATFASLSIYADNSLKVLESYIDEAANRILPNTTYLTESKIAAELLAKAGSMERLANMPASTIQLLGAEKALFKHIKFGSKPPKYGVLFKLPAIGNARKDTRGRLARAYAAKISIALKADHISKNFIAEQLKAKLDESVKRINESEVKEMRPQKAGSFKQKGWRPQRHGAARQGIAGRRVPRFRKEKRY